MASDHELVMEAEKRGATWCHAKCELAVIQAVITSRTLFLGGTTGPVKKMNPDQLHALDQGYSYGLLWVAGVAVIVGAVALFIGYTAQQVAHAQDVKDALDAGEV